MYLSLQLFKALIGASAVLQTSWAEFTGLKSPALSVVLWNLIIQGTL